MGKALNNKQYDYFKKLMGWKDDDIFDFKTTCGIFAICERLLAVEFCPQLPDRKSDPCREVQHFSFAFFHIYPTKKNFRFRLKVLILKYYRESYMEKM